MLFPDIICIVLEKIIDYKSIFVKKYVYSFKVCTDKGSTYTVLEWIYSSTVYGLVLTLEQRNEYLPFYLQEVNVLLLF